MKNNEKVFTSRKDNLKKNIKKNPPFESKAQKKNKRRPCGGFPVWPSGPVKRWWRPPIWFLTCSLGDPKRPVFSRRCFWAAVFVLLFFLCCGFKLRLFFCFFLFKGFWGSFLMFSLMVSCGFYGAFNGRLFDVFFALILMVLWMFFLQWFLWCSMFFNVSPGVSVVFLRCSFYSCLINVFECLPKGMAATVGFQMVFK